MRAMDFTSAAGAGVEDSVAFANLVSRRSLILAGGGAIAGMAFPVGRGWADTVERNLVAGPGRIALAGEDYPKTVVWCYSGSVPGPEIRLRQGDRVRVVIQNRIPEDNTFHLNGEAVPDRIDDRTNA